MNELERREFLEYKFWNVWARLARIAARQVRRTKNPPMIKIGDTIEFNGRRIVVDTIVSSTDAK